MKFKKIGIGLVCLLGLTACQSTPRPSRELFHENWDSENYFAALQVAEQISGKVTINGVAQQIITEIEQKHKKTLEDVPEILKYLEDKGTSRFSLTVGISKSFFLYLAGQIAIAAKKNPQALEYARKLEEIDHITAYRFAGELYNKIGVFKRASRNFEKGKDISRAGSAAELAGDINRAISLYSQIDAPYAIAEITEKAGMLDKSLEQYLILENKKKSFELSKKLARKSEEENDYDSAMKYYRIAAENSSEIIPLYYDDSARCAEKALRFVEAKKLYLLFATDYFKYWEKPRDFQFRAKKGVSMLFEKGELDRAVQESQMVNGEYYLIMKKIVEEMRLNVKNGRR